jgi:4-amino-4-deoxy-L-arabinose transferase-like glycosyltransferase
VSALTQVRPLERAEAPSRSELLAWGALASGAALLRVARLGDPPLDPSEGQRALEAWTLWREGRVDYSAGPLMTNALSLLFGLFTPGDGQARLLPAVAGTASVGLPWLLRPALGSGAAWCSAAVLALSPPLLVASRTASPAALVGFFLLLTAACGYRFARSEDGRWLAGALTSVLLGLGADTSFAIAIAGLTLALALGAEELPTRHRWWTAARQRAAPALGVALLIALLVDTRLLMNPSGVQAGLVEPLWRWSGELVRGGGLVAPLLLLLIDGGTLVLAGIGLAEYHSRPGAVRVLGAWLVVSLTLVTAVRQPDLRYLIQPLLPAALLAGFGLRRLFGALRDHGSVRSAVFGLAALVPGVTVALQANLGAGSGRDLWAVGTALLAGPLILSVAALNRPRDDLRAALAVALLVPLTLWNISTASRLLEARGSARAQLLDAAVVTDDLEVVRQEALRWFRADPTGPIPVDPTLRPLVAWSLRDIPTVRYDRAATRLPVPRLLAEPPAGAGADVRVSRLIVGYATERTTLDLHPARIWRWVVGRANLVDVRPYAILLAEPAGA